MSNTKLCPACKEEIKADAKKCKHCGADLRNWFVRHKVLTVILIFFIIIIIGSTSNNDTTTSNDSKESETTEKKETNIPKQITESNTNETDIEQEESDKPVIVKEPDPILYSGKGDKILKSIHLEKGYTLVKATHNGTRNIILSAIPDTGDDTLLINEIGNYSGTTLLNNQESQNYIFEITADGNWTIEITQPQKTEKTTPISLQGQGDDVILINFSKGNKIINATHTGNSNFIVSINNPDTILDFDSLIINEIGTYSGQNLYKMDNQGLIYLEIKADGNWTIDIE